MNPARLPEAAAQPTSENKMRAVLRALVATSVVAPLYASAADEKFLVELNTIESSENRCRMNFVVENKSDGTVDSMKLDLVVFGTDGGIMRRFIYDIAPLRPMKTIVRAFLVDAECRQIGAILVNDVTACAPGEPGACLDRLALSSRLKDVRLYK
jgi:hypothetical protein